MSSTNFLEDSTKGDLFPDSETVGDHLSDQLLEDKSPNSELNNQPLNSDQFEISEHPSISIHAAETLIQKISTDDSGFTLTESEQSPLGTPDKEDVFMADNQGGELMPSANAIQLEPEYQGDEVTPNNEAVESEAQNQGDVTSNDDAIQTQNENQGEELTPDEAFQPKDEHHSQEINPKEEVKPHAESSEATPKDDAAEVQVKQETQETSMEEDVGANLPKEGIKVEAEENIGENGADGGGANGEETRIESDDWRELPLTFFSKEDEKRLQESLEETQGSKKGKKGGRESLVPISDDEDSNDSAQLITWSADGNKEITCYQDILALLPLDMRGWSAHQSDCGSYFSFLHSTFDFKAMEVTNDVVLVFERDTPKSFRNSRSSYNLLKNPPQDRSTRHLLEEARGSRDRSSNHVDEAYPDSKMSQSRWNYIIKIMATGVQHRFSGPKQLTVGSISALLRFALHLPKTLKPEKRHLEEEEEEEKDMGRAKKRRGDAEPGQPGASANGTESKVQMLECFKCKNHVPIPQWSDHPCFKQAVNKGPLPQVPAFNKNMGAKRGSRNEHFCKYCKLRFKDAHSLKAHETRFPGGTCNMVINCSMCKRRFTSRGSYAIHLQNEGKLCKKGNFRCSVCKSFWADDLELIDHFRKFHACPNCKFQPNSFTEYEIHGKSCTVRPSGSVNGAPNFSGPSLSCKHCFLIFGTLSELNVHLSNSNACGEAVKFKASSDVSTHKCMLCHNLFRSKSDLAEHLKKWHNQVMSGRPYQHRCAHCPKNFATAEMLRSHSLKVHNGNAPLPSTSSSSNSYECKVCCVKFISLSGLSRHLKMKHGIRAGGNVDESVSDVVTDVSATSVDVEATPMDLGMEIENEAAATDAAGDAFLDNLATPPAAPSAAPGAPLKCSVCFLMFDDVDDFAQHQVNCGNG